MSSADRLLGDLLLLAYKGGGFRQLLLIAVSTSEHLIRFRSVFTFIPMVWTVKSVFDAKPFSPDRKTGGGIKSIRVFQ